jgi:twinkle protein
MELRYQPCSDCGSSNGKTYYDDHAYCFVCNITTLKKDLHNLMIPKEASLETEKKTILPVDTSKIHGLTDRCITKNVCEFYNVWYNNSDHVYPYFSRDGKHLANKFRSPTKSFLTQGDISKAGLFGQQLFPAGSAKQITITEGELDAMSVFQMMGKYPVVSVKSASFARKDIADNFEYLNSFDQIVICFDNDAPGQKAAQEAAGSFPLGKVRMLVLKEAKDANDYLVKGWAERFRDEWWKAPTYSPVGLKNAKDMWDDFIKEDAYESILYPFDGLNKLTYGLRTSEFVTITANPGVGKTSVVREIIFKVLQTILSNKDDSRCVGLMMLEDSNTESLRGLASLVANKPLHLPDIRSQVPPEEMKKYFDAVYGDGKVIIWDHFGSNQIDKVIDYVRYMSNLGAKYVVLDHLSIIVSDQHGDERKQLDEISTKLKTLTMELGIALICIIHQNRQGEIRGTMGVEQLSNIVIKLYRDIKNDDPEIRDIVKVTVEKNRFSGRTGPACLLRYDAETGRLIELPNEDMINYLNKDKKEEW